MLVEEEEQLVYLLQRYVEKSGCRFVSACPEAAFELARCERPAVILVDVVEVETGGRDVLRALKADPETQAIPVVMCSGWDEGLTFWAGLGAHDYLQKPVSYGRFVAMLKNAGVKLRE
jgi:CheY-like chemotaxis protein